MLGTGSLFWREDHGRTTLPHRRFGASNIAYACLLACLCAASVRSQAPGGSPSPFALEQRALKAYETKDYKESGHLFDSAFAAGLNRSEDAYNAACSYALAGDAAAALSYLDRAARMGFRDAEHVKTDTDLVGLHSDKRFALLLEHVAANKRAYDGIHNDPDRAAIATSDIDLFWTAYHKMQTSPEPEGVLERDYLVRGSPGLQDFVLLRIGSAGDLLKAIQSHPKYYAAIQPATLHIKDFSPQIHESFRKLRQLYPEATFPDVYFFIGRLNSAGTTGSSGLFLGAEMFGEGPNVPTNELSEWLQASLKSVDAIPYVVAHELIHYQQNSPTNTLLADAIHEGSADFIGELISGSFMNQVQFKYGMAHEAELWKQFSAEMHATDTSHWLYEGKTVNGRPAAWVTLRVTGSHRRFTKKPPIRKRPFARF